MTMPAPVVSCPAEIRDTADDFKDLVGDYRAFVAVLCGAVFGICGLSDLVRYVMFSPSVSALSRFFHTPGLSDKLNRRHRRRLLRLLNLVERDPRRYMWAVDDTLVSHSGPGKIWGIYPWHDHSTGGTVYGHKWLVVGLVDRYRRLLIPVAWQVLHSAKIVSEGEHRKGWQVAIELLDLAFADGFPKLPVVADSWFAGEGFFSALANRDLRFVVEIRENRIIARHGRRRGLHVSAKEFFADRLRTKVFHLGRKKWAASATVQLQTGDEPMKVVAVANRKGLVHECFSYYVSNGLTWDAQMIWRLARDRWMIEVQFRELKQQFTLGGAAVRSKDAVETAISITVIALTEIRLEQLNRVDANENQYVQPVPAGNIVDEMRLKSLRRSILTLVSDDLARSKCACRLRNENFGQKPTEAGEKPRIGQKAFKPRISRKAG